MDDTRTVDSSGHIRVGDRTVTEAITRAVADAEGISPMHVDPPLDDVVDADLLERLFAPARDGPGTPASRVIFPYRGHEIAVHAGGFLTVTPGGERDLA